MHLHGTRAPGRRGGACRGRRAGGRAGRERRTRLIRARPATAEEAAGWDALVEATGEPQLLQTRAWAELKAGTGWSAERFILEGAGLAQVLLKQLPLGISMAYAPRGPLVPVQRLPEAIVALRTVLATRRCASLLCDPEAPDTPELREALAREGVSRASAFVQPRRTLVMDLGRDPEELLGAMRRKTRQYIRKAERAGVVVEETADLDRFLAVLRAVAQRDRFAIHDRAYFERLREALGERLHLLMARVGEDDSGALLVARIGDRAWELYGGWSGAHAEERPFYLLKWRTMALMRARGVRHYDMWGLAESEADPLAGVSNFKLGFGGSERTWIGALETPVRAWLYPLWVLAGRRRLARAAA